jgi:hypothetical protein
VEEVRLSQTIQNSLAVLTLAAETLPTEKFQHSFSSPSFSALAAVLHLSDLQQYQAPTTNSPSSSSDLSAVLQEGLEARDRLVLANLKLVHVSL